MLTFTDNFYCAISSPTFTNGLLREFPRAAYADEHRVDSRSGNTARCPSVTQSSFGRGPANDLIPRMSAARRDAPHSSQADDCLHRVACCRSLSCDAEVDMRIACGATRPNAAIRHTPPFTPKRSPRIDSILVVSREPRLSNAFKCCHGHCYQTNGIKRYFTLV